MSDSIWMGGLLSYGPLEQLSCEYAWADLQRYSQPELVAWLWFKLRQVPDDRFPHGKWATLQAIEELLDNMAKADVKIAIEQAHGNSAD